MRSVFYICIWIIGLSSAIAQSNLVLNASFEDNSYPIGTVRELKKSGYLTSHWLSPLDKRSPHYFRAPKIGVAKANSGKVAVGLVLGGAKKEKSKIEYITGELKSPLVKGQTYCVSFYLLLHRSSNWSASKIGLLFHHDEHLISKVPDLNTLQASLYANNGSFVTNSKWQKFNGYFVASGGEKYLSFGAFAESESIELKELEIKSDFQLDGFQSKAFYQLDDFSVVPYFDSLDCGCASPPKKEVLHEDEKDGLQPFLFAIDASGSMRKDGVFDSLRQNLKVLVSNLPLNTPVTFSIFSSNAKNVFSGKVTGNTSNEIDEILSKVNLSGGTNVLAGLEEAYSSWPAEDGDSAQVILISDGNFTVSNNIVAIVKKEYEEKGRKLKVVHIDSKSRGYEKLEPYQASFVYVSPSELKSAIFQLYKPVFAGAIACECINSYTDTMNYHFVIDYSGSMKSNKNRAIRVVRSLFEKVPPTAVISITAFSQEATQLYIGRKSEISEGELDDLLTGHIVAGGTDPTPGVKNGLELAENMCEDRFSHLIIVTDLKADILNEKLEMTSLVQNASNDFDLAVSSVAVDLGTSKDIMLSGRAQFDTSTGVFREVSKTKFEKDLFDTEKSACDYTTQSYHYNPANDQFKKDVKRSLKIVLKEIMKGGVSMGN
jgi:Mg-chelatase subunit ChlD